jgi:hypothetical protein
MRRIGSELPQLAKRLVEPRQSSVEDFGKLIEFVACSGHRDSMARTAEISKRGSRR